jgi:type II secretory pathway pseudopilin PulG
MLFDAPRGGQIAFFEIAATLIPILVFSGVVAERHGPRPRDSTERIMNFALWIPIAGAMAIAAELLSIHAVILGEAAGWRVAFVAAMLVLGLVGVVLIVWLPWLGAFKKRAPKRHPTIVTGSCALLALVATGAVLLIVEAVDAAGDVERAESLLRQFEHENDAVRAELNRNVQELDRLKFQLQVDARASAQASERLIRAQAEGAPAVVIKSLEGRVEQEFELFKVDTERSVQLYEEGARLFKKQDRIYANLLP